MHVSNERGLSHATCQQLQMPASGSIRAARMARFAAPYGNLIAGLTAAAPQGEDLAESFPALLFALVSGYGTATQRERAYAVILDGGALKEAAAFLDLPLWLRRLPPEAFSSPLPAIPTDPVFELRIANYVPDAAEGAREWLEEVALAASISDHAFALWIARQAHMVPASRRGLAFLLIAAWQWYGKQPGTIGHRLVEHAWSPKIGLRRAREEMNKWRRRADLACLLGEGIESNWLHAGHAGGYEFVPLVTLEDFLEEARVMHNCLDQYADRLSTGMVRVFSIRRRGRPVADVELGPMCPERRRPQITQLKAARNRRAPSAVRAATEEWIDTQPLSSLPLRPGRVRAAPEERARLDFWQPFLDVVPAPQRATVAALVLEDDKSTLPENRGITGNRTITGR